NPSPDQSPAERDALIFSVDCDDTTVAGRLQRNVNSARSETGHQGRNHAHSPLSRLRTKSSKSDRGRICGAEWPVLSPTRSADHPRAATEMDFAKPVPARSGHAL